MAALALEQFDLVAARYALSEAHAAFVRHLSHSTLRCLLHAIRRHRERIGGTS
jgi:hypothetical protein